MAYSVSDSTVKGSGGEIRIREYLPAEATSKTPFLWVHGGGFVMGDLDMKESDGPARYLAERGRRVRTVEYRLAPNPGFFRPLKLDPHPNRFPAAHNDVIDVAADFASTVGGNFGLGGASAGANLVAGVIPALLQQNRALPTSLVLAYGAMHNAMPENAEVEDGLHGPLTRWAFNPKIVRRIMLNYMGGEHGLDDPRAFPGGKDLRGYPPTLTLDASNDRLRKSGHAFYEELSAAGIETEELVVEARHGILSYPGRKPFATGMAAMADWLDRHDAAPK